MSETIAEQRHVATCERNRMALLDVLAFLSDYLLEIKEPEAVALWQQVDRQYTALERGQVNKPDLELCLNECAEWLEQRQDVTDGDYGMPSPNREMSLLSSLEPCIEALERGRL